VLVRYPRALRDNPEQVRDVLVATPSGAQVTLGQLARIDVVKGSTLIKSENAYLNNIVYVDWLFADLNMSALATLTSGPDTISTIIAKLIALVVVCATLVIINVVFNIRHSW